jgi:hypothetical protein
MLDPRGILDNPQLNTGFRLDPMFPQYRLRVAHKPSLEFRIGPRARDDLTPLFLLKTFLFGHD